MNRLETDCKKLALPKINIYERAARVESFSNGSSSVMDSGNCESAGKNDSCISDSSVGVEKFDHMCKSYGEESKEGSSRGKAATRNFKNKH